MATFGDIKTAVSKRLLDPNNVSISSSDVGDGVNNSIRYWKYRRFWFNEIFDSSTLTEQSSVIPLPDDFLVPATDDDGFLIEYGEMRYPLKKTTQPVYDGLYLSNGYGLPAFYARVGQDYVVYPIPNSDYTIKRHYLKEYEPLVDNTDENDFTEYASRLMTLWTCADMSAEFRQDSVMEEYYRNAAEDEYRQLCVMTNKSNRSGKLTLNTVLTDFY